MAEKIGWEDGAVVTEEDIIAALRPLVDEYFFGETAEKGNVLVYTLPEGGWPPTTAEKSRARGFSGTQRGRAAGLYRGRPVFYYSTPLLPLILRVINTPGCAYVERRRGEGVPGEGRTGRFRRKGAPSDKTLQILRAKI